jgi:hypothetical protein
MNRVQRRFVLDALDQEDKLTEWEHGYINDLAERDEKNPDMVLSDKQNEILNRIQKKLN